MSSVSVILDGGNKFFKSRYHRVARHNSLTCLTVGDVLFCGVLF
jgi:hypothetical protein